MYNDPEGIDTLVVEHNGESNEYLINTQSKAAEGRVETILKHYPKDAVIYFKSEM